VTRILAVYPVAVVALLIAVPVLAPRSGPLALANILSVHLALAALVLVPVAVARRGIALRWSLAALGLVALLRFGGDWFSLPSAWDSTDDVFQAASWNLELGAREGAGAVEGITGLDVDVVVLQELGPDHARAITESTTVSERYPERALYPDPGVFGMGILSRWPIVRVEAHQGPALIEAVLDVGGRPVTVITAHPLAGRMDMLGPLPIALDSAKRDSSLEDIRAWIDAAIARGETVAVLGDFNVAPTEPAHAALVDGLHDAHAEVGQGPGWTWRPSSLEWMRMGLLRIDHALSSPDLAPVSITEDCSRPGDHCIVEAWFSLASVRDGDGRFEEAFPARGDIEALLVSIVDRAGLVSSVELGSGGALEDGVAVVPGRPSSLEVSWLDGMCDDRVEVAIVSFGPMIKVAVRTDRAGGAGGRRLAGILRSVILNLDHPIDTRIIEFEEVP